MTKKKQFNPRGRMLAFSLLLALLLATGIPQGQDVFAGGSGNNDTLSGAPATDSITVVQTKKKSTLNADISFGDWLLMVASMLL